MSLWFVGTRSSITLPFELKEYSKLYLCVDTVGNILWYQGKHVFFFLDKLVINDQYITTNGQCGHIIPLETLTELYKET